MLDLDQAERGPGAGDPEIERAVQLVIEALIELGARDGSDYLVAAGGVPFVEHPAAAGKDLHRAVSLAEASA